MKLVVPILVLVVAVLAFVGYHTRERFAAEQKIADANKDVIKILRNKQNSGSRASADTSTMLVDRKSADAQNGEENKSMEVLAAWPGEGLVSSLYRWDDDYKGGNISPKRLYKLAEEHLFQRDDWESPGLLPGLLVAIAIEESGGDPKAVTVDGARRGLFMLSWSAWFEAWCGAAVPLLETPMFPNEMPSMENPEAAMEAAIRLLMLDKTRLARTKRGERMFEIVNIYGKRIHPTWDSYEYAKIIWKRYNDL